MSKASGKREPDKSERHIDVDFTCFEHQNTPTIITTCQNQLSRDRDKKKDKIASVLKGRQ